MTIPADSLGTGATYSTEKARASSRGQRPPRVVRAVYGCARIPRKDTRQVPAVAETRGATRDGRVCGRRSAASAEQRGWVDTDESARSRRRRWGRDRPGATQIPFRATTPPPRRLALARMRGKCTGGRISDGGRFGNLWTLEGEGVHPPPPPSRAKSAKPMEPGRALKEAPKNELRSAFGTPVRLYQFRQIRIIVGRARTVRTNNRVERDQLDECANSWVSTVRIMYSVSSRYF